MDEDIKSITIKEALQAKINNDLTVKQYFRDLLLTLWEEGECFNGKRPFGDSGWQYKIYKALIDDGFIRGRLDKYGYVEAMDENSASLYVKQLIEALFE